MAYEYTTQGYTVNDSGRRLVVDPVTRIEGHLRCEVNINDDNVITNAVSCGTMFRGLEIIVKDRDPRDIWAFVERICGVCTGTHALASVHAIEDALKIDIPDNANIIRNLMQLALWYHDHLVHFYQLGGLDWIDVVSASKADPKETSRLAQSLSPWPQSSPGYFASVKEKLVRIISTGQLGIFKNGYWGHPGYKFPPEANLMLVAHYIEALDFQKDVVQIHTVFGGKNPHPNWLVGGVPLALNINGKGGADVINMERLELVLSIIKRCREFSAQVLVPDSIALAKFYPEWLHLGTGLSNQSLLAYGAFPSIANDYSQKSLLIPGGAIINGNFNEVLPVDLSDEDQIREEVGRSWYTYPKGVTSLHPYQGETVPHFELGPATKGSRTDIKQLDENAPYSWIKTPRWRGNMMEVGPLARTLIAYQLKQPDIVARVDDLCARIGAPVTSLQSTMGRILTRAQVPAEVRQQVQPPAFSPERNDENLSGVFVAEEREDDAPEQADGDDESGDEVGHAGIAHVKEIGRVAVQRMPRLADDVPRRDKHEKREHHAPVPDADRQLEDIDGFPFLNRFVHGVLLSPYGPSAVRCRPAPRRASHRQGRDRSCGAYARFPAAAWAHPSSCRAGRPHTGRAGRRRCAVRRSMW